MKTTCGNALFLILIAVALFAAVSYAVTQSARGGSSVDKEQALINAARYTDSYAAIQTAVQRMILTGTAAADLEFCSGGTADCLISTAGPCSSGVDCVFVPDGGGSVYETPPGATAVFYSSDTAVEGIGTASADIMSIVWGVPAATCQEINRGLTGSPTVPSCVGAQCLADLLGGNGTVGNVGECAACVGQPFLCVDASGNYIYYHVLVER